MITVKINNSYNSLKEEMSFRPSRTYDDKIIYTYRIHVDLESHSARMDRQEITIESCHQKEGTACEMDERAALKNWRFNCLLLDYCHNSWNVQNDSYKQYLTKLTKDIDKIYIERISNSCIILI